jgi:hypothetical protein
MSKIIFLGKNEAYQYLISSEGFYPNLTLNQPLMYKIKYGFPSATKITDIVANSVRDFTQMEKDRIIRLTEMAENAMSKHPEFPKTEWVYIKVSNNYEFGFPHTVNGVIVLPERVINRLTVETIIHEKIHVLQRIYPEIFRKFYISKYKLLPHKYKISDQYLVVNPDGTQNNWGYRLKNGDFLVPYCRYTNSGLQTYGGVFKNDKLIFQGPAPQEYISKFPVSQIYHPNEISAIDITNYILKGKYLI